MNIKLFVMDVDGTLTDGKIYMSANGELCKAFNIKDGLGIKKLRDAGIIPAIITGRKSDIVAQRAQELGIEEVYQGVDTKEKCLEKLVSKYQIDYENVAYIGDDENDLAVMQMVGVSFAPADAVSAVREYVDYVLSLDGGNGAVREAAEMILKK